MPVLCTCFIALPVQPVYRPHITLHISKNKQTGIFIYQATTLYVPTNMPSNAIYPNYFTCRYQTAMSVYTSYEPTAIDNLTTATHTLHNIGIYP